MDLFEEKLEVLVWTFMPRNDQKLNLKTEKNIDPVKSFLK